MLDLLNYQHVTILKLLVVAGKKYLQKIILTLWLRLWSLSTIWNITSLNACLRDFYAAKCYEQDFVSMYVQITIFIKTILESPYKVLLGPYILVAPTQPVFFFKGRWVSSNFWHLNCYNFCIILRKNAKLYFLETSHWSLKTRQKSYL